MREARENPEDYDDTEFVGNLEEQVEAMREYHPLAAVTSPTTDDLMDGVAEQQFSELPALTFEERTLRYPDSDIDQEEK